MASARTIVVGDIHGELGALETLLARIPPPRAGDTVVFLGDYVDRGPASRDVVAFVQRYVRECPARVVPLRGNHEDLWIECFREPNPGFLLPRSNGCVDTFRSFTGGAPLGDEEGIDGSEFERYINVSSWLPADVVGWMQSLPLWYEDAHGIYVHAGLDGEGDVWKHPSQGAEKPLMWMREPDFYQQYRGKRVVFGHTKVTELPLDHIGPVGQLFDDPKDVWVRGDLVGIDTGCGKGGFLSAVELPANLVYESR